MSDSGGFDRGLDFAVVDVTVERLSGKDLEWFSVGSASPLRLPTDVGSDPVASGSQIMRNDRDASLALVDTRHQGASVVHLWRGMLSAHDWFVAQRSDGRAIVADDFRTVLAALPIADRSPTDSALTQHYLYRTVYGTETYARGIRRVGSGEHVAIELRTGEVSAELIDRISSQTDLVAPDRYLSIIEESLENTMSSLWSRPGARLAFSGGVDSTLLATFLPSDSSLMTVVPDTEEFGIETEYARESAGLLGMEMEEVQVHERSYVEMLETVVDETARPPVHDVMPFLAEGYHADHGNAFVLGEGADGTIGTGGRAAKIGNLFRQRHLRAAALRLAGVAPQSFRFRAQAVIGRGSYLSSDPFGPDGYAAGAQVYGDPAFIKNTMGQRRVETVILDGLQDTLDRVDLVVPDDPFVRQMEARQWRGMFDDHIRIDSEIARVHGTSVFAPFIMSETVTAVTRIPIADRHHKGFVGKWLLKHLLAQRLPAYDVGKRKRHTGLPFTRFCTDGPLVDIWDRYSIPDLFQGEDGKKLVANTLDEAVLWNAIAYAIWDERVVRNTGLIPNAAAASVSIDLVSTA